MKDRISVNLVLAICLVVTLSFGLSVAGYAAEKKMKVAFVYNATVGDFGWFYSQDRARKLTDKALDWVMTSRLEDVKPGAQAERVFVELCEDDYEVIIAASLDYQADVLKIASQYPDVKFLLCAGDAVRNPNVESYFPQRTQLWYMMGQIAGKMTKTDTIGIVASINVPLILQLNNAWLLGAKSVNPNVKERIIFVNSFFDPAAERDAALSLIDAGADVLCQGTNTPAHVQAAQEKGVMAMSQWEEMSKFGPDAYLTGEVFNWEKYYIPTLKTIRSGTWQPKLNYPDWTSGVVWFSDFSPKVTTEIKSILKETQAKLKKDPMFFWKGPLYDTDGKLRVAAGKKITGEQMTNMSWHVEGVITSLKNK